MPFDPPLLPCTLLRRYKRFLADVRFPDGQEITVHCPNTGAMLGCSAPDSPAWVSLSDNKARKYAHTLEIVRTQLGDVGVNTGRANRLVEEALEAGTLQALSGYESVRREAAIPDEKGRFDFELARPGDAGCFVEVKSMTLGRENGRGAFPDAVSERAARHVRALARQVQAGRRAVLLFCVQHTGIEVATLAEDIDPGYAEAVRKAVDEGVEVLAYGCEVDPAGIAITRPLAVDL